MPGQPTKRRTLEEVYRLRRAVDEARRLNRERELPNWWPHYEAIDGELLTARGPRPIERHVVALVAHRLMTYFEAHPSVGEMLAWGADIALEPESIVAPATFVYAPDVGWRDRYGLTQPIVIVECLSPSSEQSLRGTKRAYYARNGVPEYWIVDADARAIERWHPSDEHAERLTDTLAWHPDAHSEAFVIDVRKLFNRASKMVDSMMDGQARVIKYGPDDEY